MAAQLYTVAAIICAVAYEALQATLFTTQPSLPNEMMPASMKPEMGNR